ncbi:hypothetical protein BTJ49_06075 [Oleiagrimonas sp. MCCC 1A03011]|nr:hypothetical protein BTJ49_06075 [Oleiagrimonas sp. MCCC 1A03011]
MAITIVFVAYSVTLYVARASGVGEALLGGLANAVPVALFGSLARRVILRRLMHGSGLRQTLGHIGLCVAFSVLALWMLTILLGMMNDLSMVSFRVTPFPTRASAWQLLENATIYGLIAMLAYLQAWRPVAAPSSANPASGAEKPTSPPEETTRHFIRLGEDILPIDLDRIVCITGADDYAEVTTPDQTHLVKMTLAEFSRTLDPGKFLRVHRSAIVNLHRVARAESAGGGRMLVHMTTGQTIKASRAGSKLLRTRIL